MKQESKSKCVCEKPVLKMTAVMLQAMVVFMPKITTAQDACAT